MSNTPRPTLLLVEKSSRAYGVTVLVCSLLLHGLVLLGLSSDARPALPQPEPVRITVRAVPPSEPAKTPEAEVAQAEPVVTSAPIVGKERAKKAQKVEAPRAVSKPVQNQPQVESEPVDFTGVTLTGTGGGFATVTGNGQASAGPVGAPPRGTRTGNGTGNAEPSDGDAEQGPKVVGLASLSRPPRAPSLDQELLQNYPKKARDQGQPGHAVVRVRIMPDGRVDRLQVLLASAPEFGKACQRTLHGSRWSAPLDESGKPVATDVSYTCQFEVAQ